MQTNSHIDAVIDQARNRLRKFTDYQGGIANLEKVEEIASYEVEAYVKTVKLMEGKEVTVDPKEVAKLLRKEFTVTQDPYAVIKDDGKDHEGWWQEGQEEKFETELHYWNRYEAFISPKIPFKVVNELDRCTDEVLGLLESPKRRGAWDRKGLVVGLVQSGKTSNYTGLICKAVDAGYKLVVVLAGMHNNLRSQTQLRLDEGFLGFDTSMNLTLKKTSSRTGVGILGKIPTQSMSLTTNAENGDFKKTRAQNAGIPLGEIPTLLVVKKNKSILTGLIDWATGVKAKKDKTGSAYIDDVPFLLIDDEADNASVNAKKDEIAAINGKIRELLKLFTKKSYVGYTATPFANVFIDPDSENSEFGKDIYPESFIINLKAPSNYFGPTRVFGLNNDEFSSLEEQDPLPLCRYIDRKNHEDHFPPKHDQHLKVEGLPEDLNEALLSFYLTLAARLARGQVGNTERPVHNSMLVHITRFNNVQDQIKNLLQEKVDEHRRLVEYNDGPFLDLLRDKWENDFIPTTKEMGLEFEIKPSAWRQILKELPKAVKKILPVKAINGSAKDTLDYSTNSKGISVICVGGEKLSRGLTLEGLSVSYFTRSARMYDTLMQMGRWFGYRTGYEDLCRLYITREIYHCFKHVTLASEELRKQFDLMKASGTYSPSDYGNAIRTSPHGMLITAMGKMRSAKSMKISFANHLTELYYYPRDKKTNETNLNHTTNWLENLSGEPFLRKHPSARGYVWETTASEIIRFLDDYQCVPNAWRQDSKLLARYIKAQISKGRLNNWVVGLMDPARVKRRYKNPIGGKEDVGMFFRDDDFKDEIHKPYTLIKARLGSDPDEALGLDNEQWEKALKVSKSKSPKKTKPAPTIMRRMREENGGTGLILLYLLDPPKTVEGNSPIVGYTVSIPPLVNDTQVEYRVTKDYLKNEFNFDEQDYED